MNGLGSYINTNDNVPKIKKKSTRIFAHYFSSVEEEKNNK
jgi:hypothetical protein